MNMMLYKNFNLNKKWAVNSAKLFSTKTYLLIEPRDVSKFSDTTPTDPDIKDYEQAQERAENKVSEFKDPGSLDELADKVENELFRSCDTVQDLKSKRMRLSEIPFLQQINSTKSWDKITGANR
jgi:hypothetical protein